MFAFLSTSTKVLRKKLNQLVFSASSCLETLIGESKSNLIDEFCGHFFATAVTIYGTKTLSSLIESVLPIASVVPNCFIASSSDKTIDLGWIRAVFEFPFISWKENKEKKLESTYSNCSE